MSFYIKIWYQPTFGGSNISKSLKVISIWSTYKVRIRNLVVGSFWLNLLILFEEEHIPFRMLQAVDKYTFSYSQTQLPIYMGSGVHICHQVSWPKMIQIRLFTDLQLRVFWKLEENEERERWETEEGKYGGDLGELDCLFAPILKKERRGEEGAEELGK